MSVAEKKTYAIILAAGKGKRMKSDLPKVLHEISGRPMIEYVLESAKNAGVHDITAVVGFGKEKVEETILMWQKTNSNMNIDFAEQKEQNGTGHAVMCAESYLPKENANILVLLGDVPFIKSETISSSIARLNEENASMLIMSMKLSDPSGYGRIIRDSAGNVKKICEEKDATDDEKIVNELNTGTFVYSAEDLWSSLKKIDSDNAQKEYYLTDTVGILVNENKKVIANLAADPNEFIGVNSKEQLKDLEEQLSQTI
ncbi:MAG: NTP transferase domain-containing protein [Spirochaetia bacterium]|nr:NTP transferase domain-containing protein [Spirochaetia bacterium]